MTGRVPVLLVVISRLGAREERLLEYPRVSALIECGDPELLVRVFLDNTEGVLMCVEGGHENQWYIDMFRSVEMLDLTDGQVEEGHVVLDFERRFRAGHTHGSTETTVNLEDGELVEVLVVNLSREFVVGNNLVCRRGFDAVPVTMKARIE